MYRVVVLSLFVITALADMGSKESVCNKFGPTHAYCCKNMPAMPQMGSNSDFKECFEKTKPTVADNVAACEMDKCMAEKLGYYGSDGNLDKDGFTKYIEKQLENDTDLFSVIKEKCLNADISKYGPANMCDFRKMRTCFYSSLYAEKCLEWSDEGNCKGIKDILQECKAE